MRRSHSQPRAGAAAAPRDRMPRAAPALLAHDLRRVFSQIAGIGDHKRDGLADIAHALDRERPLIDGRFERNQERIGELADILAGDNRPDALLRESIRRLDADDARVSVRRADDMGVQRAGGHREVIRESPTARQQRGILLANERSTEDLAHTGPERTASAIAAAAEYRSSRRGILIFPKSLPNDSRRRLAGKKAGRYSRPASPPIGRQRPIHPASNRLYCRDPNRRGQASWAWPVRLDRCATSV